MHKDNQFYNNKEINRLEFREKKKTLKSRPTRLAAILTRQCNISCIMCTRARQEGLTLPFDTLKRIYELFPYLEWIDWQGGEVFLVDYFKELFLETAKYPNITQHITTNGLLIDRDWAEILAQSKVNLLYSIDGVTRDIYELIRYGAKFEELIKSIELVNEFKKKHNSHNNLEMTAVVMRSNYKNLHLFPDFCKKYNFNFLVLNFLLADLIPEEDIIMNPAPEALNYLRRAIPQINNKCKEYNIGFDYLFKSRIENFPQDYLNKEHKNYIGHCIYPWTKIYIGPDGEVKPSCECTLIVGNLKNNTWEDIWNGHNMQMYRDLISNGQTNKICSQPCSIYNFNNGQQGI